MTTTPETMVADPQKIIAELQRKSDELTAQQAATADILKVIASSPSNVQPVFEAIAERSNRLVNGLSTAVHSIVDDVQHLMAFTPISPAADAALKALFPATLSTFIWGEAIRNGEIFRIADTEIELNQDQRDIAQLRGWRSLVLVPLLREKRAIGLISVTRREPGSFAEHQVELLQSFADQAVIAIQNARLFNEVQARTRELTEALTYQTGSANILKVIASSPTDVAPVLKAIVESACELCDAKDAVVLLKDGDDLRFSAHHGPLAFKSEKQPIRRTSTAGRAFLDREPVHVRDMLSDEGAEFPDTREFSRHIGLRSILSVPLLRDNESIGVIVLRRAEMHPFSDKQIALLRTFADQAVIAIENARLFNETQEALERQTATADVLKVIASSPTNLQPVFDAIAERSNRLMAGHSTAVYHFIDEMAFLTAFTPVNPVADAALRSMFPRPISSLTQFNLSRNGEVVQVSDIETADTSQDAKLVARVRGFRSCLFVPLSSDGVQIGLISVTRKEPGPFAEHDVNLLKTFADQAVIAIGNVRLFEKVQERTRELSEALTHLTGSANILKVIASSPTDVGPTLQAIVDSACEICNAHDAVAFLKDGDDLVLSAHHGSIPIDFKRWPISRKWITGRAVVDKAPQHIRDLLGPEGDDLPEARELTRYQAQQRTVLSVPLMQDGEAIGVISLRRTEVHPFDDKQIELLKSFADQAVIAISNVRLFEQVQERTRELSQSLEDLRAAQDRLVQTEKLASLGQLTAGIAHEIKNPLNFVNNFSSLSAELTDELKEVLMQERLTDKGREESDELTRLLKDNLEKVVQHGKRADSIVKNMLLHSREGSREHRPTDINSLLDESLNLAYHGARAEKGEFNITLERDFDENVGTIELFPQEITRAFLNLIANGVYAATKRKAEDKGSGFEPTLRATTKNLGTTVEIRIRDNGTGIPAEVQQKMFNPFFTTKPAGEGTGLGLSMTHDIIVKQHGGKIDVETGLDTFTEFVVTLPRTIAGQKTDGGPT